MKLSELLAPDIPPQVRHRGQDYFQLQRVQQIQGGPGYISAKVQGTSIYDVEVDATTRGFDYDCTCPTGAEGEICKHVWATLLAGEAMGLIGGRQQATSDWQRRLDHMQEPPGPRRDPWPERRQIVYTIEPQASNAARALIVALYMRERKAKGEGWNQRKELRLDRKDIPSLPDASDREILSLIAGSSEYSPWSLGGLGVGARRSIGWPLNETVVPLLCATGRCFIVDQAGHEIPLAWDDGAPWAFELRLEAQGEQLTLWGVLRRGETEMQVTEPRLIVAGLVFMKGFAARLEPGAPFEWMTQLRQRGVIVAPASEADSMLARLLEDPATPPLRVPESLRFEVHTGTPSPILKVRNPRASATLQAEPLFDYGDFQISADLRQMVSFDAKHRRLMKRNAEAEAPLIRQLEEAGVRKLARNEGWSIAAKDLARGARTLISHGWKIEAEGRLFRTARSARSEVTSGVDWFELHGEIDYGGATASLPAILAAARKGEQIVELGDGSFGLLPEDWLARFGAIVDLGKTGGETIRFGKNQAVLLDALLASQPEVHSDEEFERARQRLRSFEGIQAAPQPEGFTGELRGYQREGVGWMRFLREFGFGGCLADDMGVGKTAQVLAMLEDRRALRAGETTSDEPRPDAASLVVVPRSLIFNWKAEAVKFAPKLRVVDHTGIARSFDDIAHADIVLTTYGTLRRDVVEMRNIEFDYVILDEAQAVRNASTDSAKAVRLLKARHRLALTGTPVENHLGDLWSLFEFLNPGMLGSGRAFEALAASTRGAGPEGARLLGQMLRPFILRRTKQQVARELPEKIGADNILRARARAAEDLQRGTGLLPRQSVAPDRHERYGPIEDPGAGSSPASASGCVPSRFDRPQARGRRQCKARSVNRSGHRNGRGRPQDPGVLAIHQPAGAGAGPAARRANSLRVSGWQDA